MTQNLFALFLTILAGTIYFIFGQGYITLGVLFVITALTRFTKSYRDFGKYSQILLVFVLFSILINELGIAYPYSLILILTMMVIMIFYEGPEWGKLYFSFAKTRECFKLSLLLIAINVLLFGVLIIVNAETLKNPVPTEWPVDVLIIVGLGFAVYLAIMEEIIFRSFIFERAKNAASEDFAILLQGVFFGMMSFKSGVPDGWQGLLAGTIFGISLGYLLKKSQSIYLPIFVHLCVTLFVFILLIFVGR